MEKGGAVRNTRCGEERPKGKEGKAPELRKNKDEKPLSRMCITGPILHIPSFSSPCVFLLQWSVEV